MSAIEKGIVRYTNKSRGFGFIERSSDGALVSYNVADIQENSSLKIGQKVEFIVSQGNKGIQAKNIKIVEHIPD